MKMARQLLLAFAIIVSLSTFAAAQGAHVKWTAKLVPADVRAGETAQIVVTAEIDNEWHIYSNTIKDDAGVPTTIELAPGSNLVAAKKVIQPEPERKHDDTLNVDLELYEGGVAFALPVKLGPKATGVQKAVVSVKYQTCDPHVCLPPKTVKIPIEIKVAPGAARANRTKPVLTVPAQPAAYKQPAAAVSPEPPKANAVASAASKRANPDSRGLLAYMWFCFGAGFLALLTPCVFPMIPITVSFFSKRKAAAGGSVYSGPVAYCLGIIGTFTGLGILVSVLFGATGIQRLAANPIVNIGLAALFIVLAANLFGAFEITLPSGLVNRAQSGTRAGGFIGPMMMGLTFTLTSFTCTVPAVGAILVAATQGSLVKPILGMLAFSTAFASPFFLLALFPQFLAQMPKSGGWLVSVKAFMGFLEIAAALKFISNADLVWRWALITRPVFLAIWTAIFAIAAVYLLGWLRIPHDDHDLKVGWPRRFVAIATGACSLYLLAAMNGRSLGPFEAFPPPDPYPGMELAATTTPGVRRVDWVKGGYANAITLAKAAKKPVFVNFTGYT